MEENLKFSALQPARKIRSIFIRNDFRFINLQNWLGTPARFNVIIYNFHLSPEGMTSL